MEKSHSNIPPIHADFPFQSTCNCNRFDYAHAHANKCNPLDSAHTSHLQSQKSPLQLSLATECSLPDWLLAFTAGRRENDPVVRQTVLCRGRETEKERSERWRREKGVWGHSASRETHSVP